MKLLKALAIIPGIFYSLTLLAQDKCKLDIFIDEIETYERIGVGKFSTPTLSNYIKGMLHNCLGKMEIEIYDAEGKVLLVKGEYIESLDTLRSYFHTFNLDEDSEKIEVVQYMQPLRHGEWVYYNETGEIIKQEIYSKGILVKGVDMESENP